MQTFLQQAAEYIYSKYKENISDLCIVLPTRRAGFFFKNELAKAALEPIWAPEVSAMEDFICRLAKVEMVEPITLQLELYDLMRQTDPALDFDQFVGWAGTLLDDFSRMDQELVDPAKLFEYLTEAKALERWSPEKGYPNPTPVMKGYFRLWENLEKTYHALRKHLHQNKQAYPGMAYRMVAGNIETILQHTGCHQFIFIGLNAVSRAEEKIIRTMLHHRMAEVLFDSDDFYMGSGSRGRAGHFLRRYRQRWNLSEWNWQQNLLLSDAKTINVIGVPNASMQGKVAGQLLSDFRKNGEKTPVAIVLPDETMLLPVLHAIGPEVPDYNVTMGLSFKGTPLYNLIDLLFDIHLTGVVQPSDAGYQVYQYHHLTVTKLLSHPFIRRYEQFFNETSEAIELHNFVQETLDAIVKQNRVLLTAKELMELGKNHPLFTTLFKSWKDCDDIIEAFYALLDLLKEVYSHRPDNPIETEYLYIFYTIVKRLDTIFDCREQRISVRSFRKFLYEQIGQTRLPFSGEPISDVQIMGFLETRALDFENLIILNVNENMLPQPKKHRSLMPYDVLKTFGLPTYSEQESITSYYFYRLLQRAKNINLLYVLPSDTYGSGEKSRFILQLQHDLALQNPNIQFNDLTAVVEQQEDKRYNPDIIIEKDEVLRERLKQELAKGLYPSHLNMYINCSLQYYFSRIAKIQETDTVDEQLGADQFGNVVHKVLEDFFQPFVVSGELVDKQHIEDMLERLPVKVQEEFRRGALGELPEHGMNYVLFRVALQVLEKYLKQQLHSPDLPLRILRLEQTLTTTLSVPLSENETISVKIAGKADRIDRTGNKIRVIDYKTGKVEAGNLKVKPEDLELHFLTARHYDKVRQLWLYRYILAKETQPGGSFYEPVAQLGPQEPEFEAAILSFRNLDAGLLTSQLDFGNGNSSQSYVEASEQFLRHFVQQLLDPSQPIRKTHDLEVCQYCPYRGICAR